MTQKTSPYLEGKYGWDYGESGWNIGMDENLLKFSFLFDRNIDDIVSTLPAAVNGKAYFLTSDNRLYFAVGNNFYSTPTPKFFQFQNKSTGQLYTFDGTSVSLVDNVSQLDARLDNVELSLSQLGTASTKNTEYFASQSALTTGLTQANTYTDDKTVNLAPKNSPTFTGTVSGITPAMVGLANVDNTSDINKPISSATQTALSSKQNVSNFSMLSGTSSSLDANTSNAYGAVLTSAFTITSITGAIASRLVEISVIFTQDSVGGRSVALPSNVKLPQGLTSIVSSVPSSATIVKFFNFNNDATWYVEQVATYTPGSTPVFVLPTIAGENSTFTDEGDSVAGWTTSNSTVSSTSSRTLFTKTSAAGTGSNMVKPVTLPASGRDFSIFGKVKVKNAASNSAVIWLTDGTKELGLWFGSNDGGGTITAGAMSITGYTTARTLQSFTPGIDYGTTDVDFELAYDSTFGTATLYFRQSDGTWLYKARVLHTWFSVTNIAIQTPSASAAGVTVDFDYLMVARPNILAIGDSICAGSTGFNPNPSLNLVDYSSTWMRYAKLYLSLRNNRVGNKGIGGQTSTQTLARITDVTNQSPQLTFLHASTNDEGNSVSQSTRTTNIQNTVNALVSANSKVVLLNGLYGVSGSVDNTSPRALRDYQRLWWNTSSGSITGISTKINIELPIIITATEYQDPAYTQADGLHPNPSGYSMIGQYISQ